MIWIAPSEKDTATETLERRLGEAADQFRANSGIEGREYLRTSSTPPSTTCLQLDHAA